MLQSLTRQTGTEIVLMKDNRDRQRAHALSSNGIWVTCVRKFARGPVNWKDMVRIAVQEIGAVDYNYVLSQPELGYM
jgi:hypothetical protein